MSLQMPPSELEQQRQLNANAMSDVATGGVTEMAESPVLLAGNPKGVVLEGLLSLFRGTAKNVPEGTVGEKPRVPAEGNLESDQTVYRDTQDASAAQMLSDEGQAKFKEQGNMATDLSPEGQRLGQALSEVDETVELTPDQELRATVTAGQRGVTADAQGFNLTEDSSGLASQSQADEVLEGAALGESYLKSIEEGAPFNWDKLKQPDDVKSLIQAVSDSLPDQELAATRGVISNAGTVEAATGQLADALGLTRRVLKRQRGTTFRNAADATAARMLLADSAKKLALLANDVRNRVGGDKTLLLFRRQLAIHNGIQLQIKGAQTEAARLLQSFNIPVTDGMAPDAAALMNMDVIEASGGAKSLMMAATGLVEAAKKGEANFNQAAQAGIGSKIRNGLEHLYINGLLSGPKTQFKNVFGNALFIAFQLPEEFVAGVIGSAERGVRRAVGSEIDYTNQVYMSDFLKRMNGFYYSFGDAFKAAYMAAKTAQPGDTVSKVEMNTYRSGTASNTPFDRAMHYVHNATSIPTRLLLAGDDLFKVLSQNGELHVRANRQKQAALAAGMTARQAQDEADMVLLSPRQFAGEVDVRGRYDTLMSDLGQFGKSSAAIQNTIFGRYLLPFATAPTNDIIRTLERSNIMGVPLGLLFPETYSKNAAKRQTMMARMAVGGFTTSIVAMYATQGRITGAMPSDKKVREKLPPGWQPYSFVFRADDFPVDEAGEALPPFDKWGNPNGPLKYVSYSGLGPVASMIGITAGTVQRMTFARSAEDRQSMAGAAVYATGDYFRELPMLQGVARILTSLEREDFSLITQGPLGSMNLVPGIPNPFSAISRTTDRVLDNQVTKAEAPFEVYTLEEVQRLTDDKVLAPAVDGDIDYRLIGTPKGTSGDVFMETVYNSFLDMIDTNLFADNQDANIPVYDTLGRPVTRGPSFEEAPLLRIYNGISPIVMSESLDQPEWVDELVKLDWPIPQAPSKVEGVTLTEMQKSNLVWLAKGSPDDLPANLQGLDLRPVVVDFQTFEEAMSELLDIGNFDFYNQSVKKRRNQVRALNQQFMDAAFQQLVNLPGNERMDSAVYSIRMLEQMEREGMR